MSSPRAGWRALAVLLVVLACAGMTVLGFWQLARGQAKQALLDAEADVAGGPAQPLVALGPATLASRAAYARGRYLPQPGLLLDGQSHARRPGVAAWSLFELDDGSRVLVNRGWLPLAGGLPPALPPAPVAGEVRGRWRRLPAAGMRLAGQESACALIDRFPVVVQYPRIEELRCFYGARLRDGLLDLAPGSAGAFVPLPQAAAAQAVPPQRHYGYAAQWWAFAVTLAVLATRYLFRSRSRSQ